MAAPEDGLVVLERGNGEDVVDEMEAVGEVGYVGSGGWRVEACGLGKGQR